MSQPRSGPPPAYNDRFGTVFQDDVIWGYVHVFHSSVQKHAARRLRSAHEGCLVEEFFRTLPPKPAEIDWADELGLSDALIRADQFVDEIARLDRGELLYLGRTLRIEWADPAHAEQIESRYFSETRG